MMTVYVGKGKSDMRRYHPRLRKPQDESLAAAKKAKLKQSRASGRIQRVPLEQAKAMLKPAHVRQLQATFGNQVLQQMLADGTGGTEAQPSPDPATASTRATAFSMVEMLQRTGERSIEQLQALGANLNDSSRVTFERILQHSTAMIQQLTSVMLLVMSRGKAFTQAMLSDVIALVTMIHQLLADIVAGITRLVAQSEPHMHVWGKELADTIQATHIELEQDVMRWSQTFAEASEEALPGQLASLTADLNEVEQELLAGIEDAEKSTAIEDGERPLNANVRPNTRK